MYTKNCIYILISWSHIKTPRVGVGEISTPRLSSYSEDFHPFHPAAETVAGCTNTFELSIVHVKEGDENEIGKNGTTLHLVLTWG